MSNIDMVKIINETALYETIDFNKNDTLVYQLLHKSIWFDAFCIYCEKDSIFSSTKEDNENSFVYDATEHTFMFGLPDDHSKSDTIMGVHSFTFTCQRHSWHRYFYQFKVDELTITKIGQHPSIGDIELHKINKYRFLLKDDYREFSKAIGLYSHGIGAGSYVYLRRIFENIINEQKQIALESDSSLSEEEFNKKRMDEKILYIKDFLPDILVETRKTYSILSKGIHELSEKQCLELFPVLESAIEIILDWKLEMKQKELKEKQLRDSISRIHGELKL